MNHHPYQQATYLQTRSGYDWLWAALLLVGAGYVFSQYQALMDGYEIGILLSSVLVLLGLGWQWSALKTFSLTVTTFSLLAISRYGDDLSLGETAFLLKYLFASQSAIMWMSALYVMATLAYLGLLFSGRPFVGKVASSLTWSATAMGMTGLMVRWRESYLMGADIGHIPVSNLYEVFILFSIITALLYLHYEQKYQTRSLGGFVLRYRDWETDRKSVV